MNKNRYIVLAKKAANIQINEQRKINKVFKDRGKIEKLCLKRS